MPNFSGSFSGRANSQTTIAARDSPDHELNLVEITGPQTSSDQKWNGATVTYWGISDLSSGSGSQRGYFTNEHANGDRDQGLFEGTVTADGNEVALEGIWRFSGGTGSLRGLSGSGTYKGRMTSPSEVEMSWEGSYQLA
jgi:hypothetical protein